MRLIIQSCALVVIALLLNDTDLAASEPSPPSPRLVVLVVFDQLRGDYLERWRDLWQESGFRRLQKEGAWFQNCRYPYAFTFTGPGHASIVTGCSPDQHGIIGDYWLDRNTGKEIDCAVTDRHDAVPIGQAAGNGGSSPEAIRVETVGDSLKTARGAQSRVVSLSLKDRSAVLMGGKKADACYWLDQWSGQFMTSTYYRDSLHPWVREFNRGRPADHWFRHDWTRLRPDLDYARFSGPDDVAAEDRAWFQGRTFPHPTTGGLDKPGRDYYGAVSCSPFGNDLLLALVERAIAAEKLGRHAAPDLLCVGFSSNDDVGHAWGPDSQEVLDMTLRSDRVVRRLLDILDQKVGRDGYLLVLTSDHGVCPLPEVSRTRGKDAQRIAGSLLIKRAEQFLSEKFGKPPEQGRWILGRADSWLYLNFKQVEEKAVSAKSVEESLANWLRRQPEVLAAYSRNEITANAPGDPMLERVRKSYDAERSGDLAFVLKPYYLLTSGLRGTLHGSPHEYDTHVPLLVYGSGIGAGQRAEAVTPLHVATILSKALGITPPAKCEPSLPARLFQPSR